MLKLHYTENGLFIEQVSGRLEAFISQRVILAIRAGQELHVQPGQAAFLLANQVSTLAELAVLMWTEQNPAIAISVVDLELIEVCIDGTWITEQVDAEEGTFLITAPEQTEALLFRLWQESQASISSLA
ncbi:MAG: hypothetical protein KME35_02700 [Aphanocapsa sp. GSE-SYN-MK-11-07L]|jgi:hypothetical protein|nr:hypothetical protein [Aphanocapsa sp. GSE-SYN-MK-11-07L]